MRIAYLAQSYPPMISGAAISAEQTAEALAKRGHQVLVIAASDRGYPYHVYRENLTILRLRSHTNPLRVGQRLMSRPRKRVLKLLRQFQPDVIHAHEPVQMGMLALDYAKRAHIPAVLTVHQLPWFVASYLPKPFRPIVEKTLWACAPLFLGSYSALIAPTQTIAGIIEKKTGLRPGVIGYGLDLRMFHPLLSPDLGAASRSRLGLPSDVPLLLHVGRLDTDKSVDQMLCGAAPAILESDAHLLVVGDGCQKDRLVRLCGELGIRKRVHFTGYIPPADLPDIYRMSDIFVTASEIETQGIVLLEAAASGLPIVAVDATCISEIVKHNKNGFLIEPGDHRAFGNALTNLINGTKRAYAMGMNGRILAGRHDLQISRALHEGLYQEMYLINRRQRSAKLQARSAQWKFVKTLIGLK